MSKNPRSIKHFVSKADYVSLGNVISGFFSILASIEGKPVLAMGLILLAAVFDFFDGKVARKYNISSDFGRELDSLCDLISFILAPVLFAYFVGYNGWLEKSILALYVVMGTLRLARFNVTGTIDGGKFFEGVPVPVSLILPVLYFGLEAINAPSIIFITLFLIHGVLMISTVKIKKP